MTLVTRTKPPLKCISECLGKLTSRSKEIFAGQNPPAHTYTHKHILVYDLF